MDKMVREAMEFKLANLEREAVDASEPTEVSTTTRGGTVDVAKIMAMRTPSTDGDATPRAIEPDTNAADATPAPTLPRRWTRRASRRPPPPDRWTTSTTWGTGTVSPEKISPEKVSPRTVSPEKTPSPGPDGFRPSRAIPGGGFAIPGGGFAIPGGGFARTRRAL